MLIPYFVTRGTKVFRSPNGIAADFCPICRHVSPVDFEQVCSQRHVNYIGYGPVNVEGYACRCRNCRSEWSLRPNTIRSTIHPITFTTLPDLVAQTFPHFQNVYAERLRQEEIIRHDPSQLAPETRLTLLTEPFAVLENDVQDKKRQPKTWEFYASEVGCLGTFVATIWSVVAFFNHSPIVGTMMLVGLVGLSWLTLHLHNAATRKYMHKSIYPRLASCLASLRPTLKELEDLLASREEKCAKQTVLQEFVPFLEEARAAIPKKRAEVLPPPVIYGQY